MRRGKNVKSKLVLYIIAMLIVIVLILGAALLLWNYFDKKTAASANPGQAGILTDVKPKKLSASEVKDLTVEVKDIMTNLADKDKVIRVSFAFQMDNKKARDEFET